MKSTQRFELEISENAFICVEDESRTYIWEWKTMDPELLDTFMAIRQEVREIIKRALSSDAKAGFGFVAEDFGNYEDPSPQLCAEHSSIHPDKRTRPLSDRHLNRTT